MELENIFDIGKYLGLCKIWTTTTKVIDSPFFSTMPIPLKYLFNKLEELSIEEKTKEEINKLIEKSHLAIDLQKQNRELRKNGEVNKEKLQIYTEKQDKLINQIREDLINFIPIWEDRIANKLRKIKVVKLSTDTRLNPEKLSIGASSFFKEDIWNNLSDIEKKDLEDASRCISLQAWTPAAMITMRAIEAAFRDYYQKILTKDPGTNWGQMIIELKSNPSVDQKLIGYFDYLKDIRNTLQHPDARFSQFEAEDAFHHAIHILSRIHF